MLEDQAQVAFREGFKGSVRRWFQGVCDQAHTQFLDYLASR